jgi:hypothetical protein
MRKISDAEIHLSLIANVQIAELGHQNTKFKSERWTKHTGPSKTQCTTGFVNSDGMG